MTKFSLTIIFLFLIACQNQSADDQKSNVYIYPQDKEKYVRSLIGMPIKGGLDRDVAITNIKLNGGFLYEDAIVNITPICSREYDVKNPIIDQISLKKSKKYGSITIFLMSDKSGSLICVDSFVGNN